MKIILTLLSFLGLIQPILSQDFLQKNSTPNHYFKILVRSDEYKDLLSKEIRVYSKDTDKLLQTIPVDIIYRGLESIQIGDFNFDGIPDFSIFETFYTGTNTSSQYFLFDPRKKHYVDSGFQGISLQFNEKTKEVYEENSCCGGRELMLATYKIENNKMVLIHRKCSQYSDSLQEYIDVRCEGYD